MPDVNDLPRVLRAYGSDLFEAMRADELAGAVSSRAHPASSRHWSGAGGVVLDGMRRWRRGLSVAAATATAGVVAAVLLLSGGVTPSVASAFPILARPTVDLSHRIGVERALVARRIAPNVAAASLRRAHEFTTANGNGFAFETTDGTQICIVTYPPPGFLPGQPDAHNAGCAATADALQHGILAAAAWGNGSQQLQTYEALVPTGGSLAVTSDGTTTSVPVGADGIATGVVNQTTTVTLTVGDSSISEQVG